MSYRVLTKQVNEKRLQRDVFPINSMQSNLEDLAEIDTTTNVKKKQKFPSKPQLILFGAKTVQSIDTKFK